MVNWSSQYLERPVLWTSRHQNQKADAVGTWEGSSGGGTWLCKLDWVEFRGCAGGCWEFRPCAAAFPPLYMLTFCKTQNETTSNVNVLKKPWTFSQTSWRSELQHFSLNSGSNSPVCLKECWRWESSRFVHFVALPLQRYHRAVRAEGKHRWRHRQYRQECVCVGVGKQRGKQHTGESGELVPS